MASGNIGINGFRPPLRGNGLIITSGRGRFQLYADGRVEVDPITGAPSPLSAVFLIQGKDNSAVNGPLTLADGSGRSTAIWNNDGRVDFIRYSETAGAIVTIRISPNTPANGVQLGHYAFMGYDSARNLHSMSYLDATVDDITSSAINSSIRLNYMDAYNAAGNPGVVGQPNKIVLINRIGLQLPGTSFISQGATIANGNPQIYLANNTNIATEDGVYGCLVYGTITPTANRTNQSVYSCEAFVGNDASHSVSGVIAGFRSRVNMNSGACSVGTIAAFRGMDPVPLGVVKPTTAVSFYSDYVSGGGTNNYFCYFAASGGGAAYTIDNVGNIVTIGNLSPDGVTLSNSQPAHDETIPANQTGFVSGLPYRVPAGVKIAVSAGGLMRVAA